MAALGLSCSHVGPFQFLPVGSSSLTRDQTHVPCTRSSESWPLDHQGSPTHCFYYLSFIISLELGIIKSSNFVLLPCYIGHYPSLHFHLNFRNNLFHQKSPPRFWFESCWFCRSTCREWTFTSIESFDPWI